ncbi:hypothetical protein QYE76_064151 [Lolium multiflorum]|uniref:Reverse transcriptase Ty1/copia-type domain-containing protein n=1 Tax=Lolium multiflorum TaxID=4521 RepID=A0AAD8S7N2_LOLMU|nr:hypothetical protein QYE76_064151 [Lolium multiflorum]
MQQPPGFEDAHPQHVCKLQRSIYGLKQSPRAWYARLSARLFQLGFKSSKADTSLFIFSRDSVQIYMLVYVDDIVIVGSTPGVVDRLVQSLSDSFPIKDLGPLDYFLGLEASFNSGGMTVTQRKFHVGAGIPGVAPHYIPPPSTFNVLIGSSWNRTNHTRKIPAETIGSSHRQILVRKYSRNWINAQVPILPGSIQNTREPSERGYVGPTHGGAARPWPRRPVSGPRTPSEAALSLQIASVAKPPESHDTENLPETPPRIPSRGIREIASGTLPERGFISGGLYTAMVASGVMSE